MHRALLFGLVGVVVVLITFQNNFARLMMARGNYYFNGGAYDLKKAERGFARAVAIDPKILWGHYQLARIYFVKGEYNKALEEINKELEMNPENLRSLYVRGLIRAGMNDLAGAEEDFYRFVAWAPKEWAGYNDLAWILAKQGKYAEARDAILTAFGTIKDAQENVWLQNSIGVAYLNMGDYSNAKLAFLKARAIVEKMDENKWLEAYPGNNPVKTKESFTLFKEAINLNLARASVDNR